MGVKIYDDGMRRAALDEIAAAPPAMHPYSDQALRAMEMMQLKPARIRISTIKWKGNPCWVEYHGLTSRLPRGRLYVCEDGHWHSAWFSPRNGRSGRWVRAWSVPTAHWTEREWK